MTTHLRVGESRIRCGRILPDGDASFDAFRVTCSTCRRLGYPHEDPPGRALRLNSFMTVTDVDGGERGRLHLRTVLFLDGGTLIWHEEPDVLAVMPALGGGEVHRYQGIWGDPEADSSWAPHTEDVNVQRGVL